MKRKMTALIIGNGKYPESKLENPTNDSEDITSKLDTFGFTTNHLKDTSKENIDRAVKSFKDSLNSNDVGLFYFAGHGLQIEGENYITAIDTDFTSEIDVKYSAYPLNKIIEIMEQSDNSTNIIILDACRNNPYERSWNRDVSTRGLAPVYAPKGTIIAYGTSPGEVASDGKGRNGAYTEALLMHIGTPDIAIEDMFKRVRNSLSVITKSKQTSWEHTSLSGDFFFNMSLGNSITEYSKEAISDSQFNINQEQPLHTEIKLLKIYDWYKQNPAVRGVADEDINQANLNTAFVFGRNIYQAACGNSDGAIEYIKGFKSKTKAIDSKIKKAIFDGILFEIFFNSNGEIRKNFKISYFNEVFLYQKYSEFDKSFEFISDVLIKYQNRFHVIPGKTKNTTIDIESEKNEKGENKVKAIYLFGNNILRQESMYDYFSKDGDITYEPMKNLAFERKISEDMLIPINKLEIQSSFKENKDEKILFPNWHTLEK